MANKEIIRPVIAIVGGSGTGKSSAIGRIVNEEGETISENLPPEKTIIWNTERQPIPAENARDFLNVDISTVGKWNSELDWLLKMSGDLSEEANAKLDAFFAKGTDKIDYRKYDYIVVESYTSFTEMLNAHLQNTVGGWNAYNEYAVRVKTMLDKLKNTGKYIFMLAITETKDEASGDNREFIAVHGKAMKFGKTEKEFVVVLYTDPQFDDETGFVDKVYLEHRMNRKNTAKAPTRMFPRKLPNDLKAVADYVDKFYGNT